MSLCVIIKVLMSHTCIGFWGKKWKMKINRCVKYYFAPFHVYIRIVYYHVPMAQG